MYSQQAGDVFKKTIFQLHWLFGITAGLVLSLMGLTGALYSFQEEILQALNPQTLKVQAQDAGILPASELVQRLEASGVGKVTGMWVHIGTGKASQAFYAPTPGQRRGPMRYFDPYTGELQGHVAGQGFFAFVLQLHRFLAIGETGKQITAACTLMLLFFCLSGLYLRWPKNALRWRTWLTFNWAKKGRAFNWDLHAVAGTWCLLFYLVAALTGLIWSYDWFRDGASRVLTGTVMAQRGGEARGRPATGPAPQANWDAIWASIQQAGGPDTSSINLRLPVAPGQPANGFYLLASSPHGRAFNQMVLNPVTGAVLKRERYADKPLGEQLFSSNYAVHTGDFFGLPGRLLMTAASLCMPLFFITGWLLYLDRRRKKRHIRLSQQGLDGAREGWLIAFASQSGFAEQLAWQAAARLQAGGQGARVVALGAVSESDLKNARRALFVVSTFGDGEAPDTARLFEKQLAVRQWPLPQLEYGLLALGDRSYSDFCGFGRRLAHWLDAQGARPLFVPVEVDSGDAASLARWNTQLATHCAAGDAQTGPMPWQPWPLMQRTLLNPGSAGAPLFELELGVPLDASWQAGDVLEIVPPGQPLATQPRAYSIASLPSDSCVRLLVRQHHLADGRLGRCSGWLTTVVDSGDPIEARVRRNSNFHLPQDDRPLILIGNGSGLAGLSSLLKARIQAGQRRTWLIFGERNRATDFIHQAELEGWHASADLARLDTVFSRDQAQKRYVQHVVLECAVDLRQWVADGAAIYVCGSLEGMAQGVDGALREVLGDAEVDALIASGRYRRDVY